MAKKKSTPKAKKAAKPAAKRGRTPPAPPPLPPESPPPIIPPEPGAAELSDNERRFVDEWLVDRRAGAAYRRVFPAVSYRAAYAQGRAWRARPHVAAEIDDALRAQSIRTNVRADAVLLEISRIAQSDVYDLFDPQTNQLRHPRHIPIDVRRCISSIKVSRERRTTVRSGSTSTIVTDSIVEYRLWPKNDALGKLAAYLGLNVAIPPLDALLQALPPDMAQQIRTALIAQAQGRQSTPTNGNGKAHT